MAHALTPGPLGSSTTEARLLAAAERLFAERGFAATSVREITSDAGTSVAAVNYHFGSKENLYRELIVRRLRAMRERRLEAIRTVLAAHPGHPDPTRLLSEFAGAFLEPVSDWRRGRVLVRLMTRELVDRNLPPEVFAEEMIRPVETAFVDALRRAFPGLSEDDAILSAHSFVAQLMHVIDIASLYQTLDTRQTFGRSFDDIVAHIVRFSCAGLSAYASGRTA